VGAAGVAALDRTPVFTQQCNQVDAVVSPSRQMREKLREYGVMRPIAVVPTGLAPDSFQNSGRNSFRQRHGIADARASLGRYFTFYNTERRHQSLDRRTPDSVYYESAARLVA